MFKSDFYYHNIDIYICKDTHFFRYGKNFFRNNSATLYAPPVYARNFSLERVG